MTIPGWANWLIDHLPWSYLATIRPWEAYVLCGVLSVCVWGTGIAWVLARLWRLDAIEPDLTPRTPAAAPGAEAGPWPGLDEARAAAADDGGWFGVSDATDEMHALGDGPGVPTGRHHKAAAGLVPQQRISPEVRR